MSAVDESPAITPLVVEWRGTGQKAKDEEVIPLCEAHQQHSRNAIHLMGKKAWEQ
ncbi:hypothetical protein ACS4RR_026355 (plasmid) [Rhizobium sp. Z1P35]